MSVLMAKKAQKQVSNREQHKSAHEFVSTRAELWNSLLYHFNFVMYVFQHEHSPYH